MRNRVSGALADAFDDENHALPEWNQSGVKCNRSQLHFTAIWFHLIATAGRRRRSVVVATTSVGAVRFLPYGSVVVVVVTAVVVVVVAGGQTAEAAALVGLVYKSA